MLDVVPQGEEFIGRISTTCGIPAILLGVQFPGPNAADSLRLFHLAEVESSCLKSLT